MYFEPSLAEIQSSALVIGSTGKTSRLPILQASVDRQSPMSRVLRHRGAIVGMRGCRNYSSWHAVTRHPWLVALLDSENWWTGTFFTRARTGPVTAWAGVDSRLMRIVTILRRNCISMQLDLVFSGFSVARGQR
jgi:hypothetical protein